MIEFYNYWWPDRATADVTRYIQHTRDMMAALKVTPGRKAVVQAGGHCGVWPLWLAERFDTVFTFEPAKDNYECLEANLAARPRLAEKIVHFNAALGDRATRLEMQFNQRNTGGHKITKRPGDVPVTTIDGLALEDACDLIVLDVEGMELPVLRGAERTMKRLHPTIMLEQRGHGDRHGWGSDGQVASWLAHQGYRQVGQVSYDQVWIYDKKLDRKA